MAVAKNVNPVVVRLPDSEQFVTLARGMEFPDDHPLVKEFGWAFEDDDTPAPGARVASVPIPQVEQATRAPGEKRRVGRPRKEETEDKGSGNGPIRSDSLRK